MLPRLHHPFEKECLLLTTIPVAISPFSAVPALPLSHARDLHSSTLFLPYIIPTHGALFHLFCTLLSNLSPCTAPSTAKTLCDSSIRRPLPTTIPANSNQSINPYGTYHTPRPATPFLNPCTCVMPLLDRLAFWPLAVKPDVNI
jgi:hypothetical protein